MRPFMPMLRLLLALGACSAVVLVPSSRDTAAGAPPTGAQTPSGSGAAAEVARIVALLRAVPGLTPALLTPPKAVGKPLGGTQEFGGELTDPKTQAHIGSCSFGTSDGHVNSLMWSTDHRTDLGRQKITAAQARVVAEAAQECLIRGLPVNASLAFQGGSKEPSAETDGLWFGWAAPRTAGIPVTLSIEVNVFSGKITQVHVSLPPPLPDAASLAKLRSQALAQLADYMKAHGYPAFRESEIVHEWQGWHTYPEGQRYVWMGTVAVNGDDLDDAPGNIVVARPLVYPTAGGVTDFETREVPAAEVRLARKEGLTLQEAARKARHFDDHGPVSQDWTAVTFAGGKRVALKSSRRIAGYPSWREVELHVCLTTIAGEKLAALSLCPDLPCLGITATANGNWVAYQVNGRMDLRNVETGASFSLADEEGAGLPDGLYSAALKPRVYGPVRDAYGTVRWRVFLPPSKGTRLVSKPVWGLTEADTALYPNPADTAAIIVTEVPTKQKMCYKLSRAAMTAEGNFGPRNALMANLAALPVVSWFSDGTRFVCATNESAGIVEVASGKATKLELGALRDPDTGQALVVESESIRALGEGKLLFCERQALLPPGRGARVYVVAADGTGLRRLTPLDETPTPIYVFPGSGRPAFDLAVAAKAR